ncbi:MAG: DUF11 domain-containing protein [Saprospiraceae bacterium]|nr:DUF11 domain-containing protein [Saprospiraceae bacterium]
MLRPRFFLLLTSMLLLCWSSPVVAQGWQRFYGGAWDERAFALRLLPDGSLLAAGSNSPDSTTHTDWYFIQTDAWGAPQASFSWGDTAWSESANILLPRSGGGWLLGGTRSQPNSSSNPVFQQISCSLLDAAGQPEASLQLDSLSYLTNGCPHNGGFLLTGARYFPFGTDTWAPRPYFARLNAAGQWLGSTELVFGQYGEASDALSRPDGSAVLTGWYLNTAISPNFTDLFVLALDAAGNSIDTLLLSLPGQQRADRIVALPNDQLLVLGRAEVNSAAQDLYLVALDAQLDTLWTRRLSLPGSQHAHAALVLADGRIMLAGETTPLPSASRDAFLACTDPAGNLLWFNTYGGLKGDIFWALQQASDGGFALAGQTASFGPNGDLQAWLLRTDSLGTLWSHTVSGRVVLDTLMDCMADAQEPGLDAWVVTAAGAPGTVYALTDSLGQYTLRVDTGAWYLSVQPASAYWSACLDSVPVTFGLAGQTTELDFPVQSTYNCPLLQVGMTTPFLRRCFDNTYAIRYFNYGPAPAQDARAAVLLDPYLTPTAASLPFAQSGDTLWFELGDVAALTGGTFTVTAYLDCDSSVLGQLHCSSVHVVPDSLCSAFDPVWDGSNLVVSGYCAGDSVVFTITNTGPGNMSVMADFVITEDQIIFKREPLQLAAGADTTIVLYPKGKTVTLIVPQSAGHPSRSNPMLVIEGCGGLPFSTGYGLQFPTNDGDPFTDVECRASIGSYDPNDKIGQPLGVDAAHVIRAGTALEYLLRFQNTGTDTAFRVEIRDTLPAGFDLNSLEWGASSHAYRPEWSGQGVLRFVFDPIALPDSSADFAGSQGFVQFRISTLADLAAGTRIENRAAIYFDHNTPVLTAATWHTIGEPLEALLVADQAPASGAAEAWLLAQPNPFLSSTQLRWRATGVEHPYRVEIRDALGRQYYALQTNEPFCRLETGTLAAGWYAVCVYQSGRPVASGKIVVQ